MTTVAAELPVWWEAETPVFDARRLTGAQRAGQACVVCHRRWPPPRIRVGIVPDGTPVHACGECAPMLRPARVTVRGLLHAAAILVLSGNDPMDLHGALKAAAHHLLTEACDAGSCRLCEAVPMAVIALAAHVQRTEELLAAPPVPVHDDQDANGDLDRALAWLRAWLDQDHPPAAVVAEALMAAATEFDQF